MGSYVLFQNSFDSDTWTGVALSKTRFRYRAVAVGGTFDILHIGHEKLLAKAFELGELVFVGVTGDRLVSKLSKDHPVRTFAVRRRTLRQLLKAYGWLERARITAEGFVRTRDPKETTRGCCGQRRNSRERVTAKPVKAKPGIEASSSLCGPDG